MPHYDSSDGDIFVYVRRESGTLLSSMGHDVKIRVDEFSVDVDFEEGHVRGHLEAGSLHPVDAVIWESREETGELSRGDRREIGQRINREVLETDEYPNIEFESTAVEQTDGGWRVRGELELHGETKEVAFDVERRDGRAYVDAVLDHTDFGIDQYSAMLGSLKVAPEVVIEVDIPLPDAI